MGSKENTKEGKAGGSDGITIEHIKAGGSTIVNALNKLFNKCLEEAKVPYKANINLMAYI